ncbi:flagellar basal body P-ring formation chaperone FlgA [Providencia sneebia]|uniref:Flagella basal body P-ring formation protein FlgA n=1 Tax=Providencia sneebia DSM 19967 TaxID=1141660 RepID=K8WQX5_9GAMM|nr:flagellar basal body P-ring formation chaperone FlgA [Providencia sneebia]EKT58555.1 flagellar basal body P-ring biosynthesis protein FlgA [Providencia sneebia DSM 19967]
MKYFYIPLFFNLLFFSSIVESSLSEYINDYFHKIYPAPYQVSVTINTSKAYWPKCEKPKILSPIGRRFAGTISLPVQCDKQTQFIQLAVNVTTGYYVAAHNIERNKAIQLADLIEKKGLLHQLPDNVVINKMSLQGDITLQKIYSDQILTHSLFRKPWAIKSGQLVYVFVNGNNFSVKYEGRAMSNAKLGDDIRILLLNGQTIHGKALENGSVMITIK